MMLYLDNAATTLKKPLSVYATLFKSTLFSGETQDGEDIR